MNRIYNVFMWAFALTVMIALTVRLTWADTITMADVAMGNTTAGKKKSRLARIQSNTMSGTMGMP